RQSALRRGFDIGQQRARRAQASDFEQFDYVLAMDDENYRSLERLSGVTHKHKLKLLLEFAPHLNEREVPDPYYGGASGFERVIDLVEEAARGLLADIRQRHLDV
ncbi:MAG: low molecular weight phosphotyrosine protein phosphatase, partial [Gammaproteobacteria bacterium]|nr:low molecular weight phosphotyrosine protein phosphatase [Gammaproteobacteria bacterium]